MSLTLKREMVRDILIGFAIRIAKTLQAGVSIGRDNAGEMDAYIGFECKLSVMEEADAILALFTTRNGQDRHESDTGT